ncbi:probable sugar phosphate/phosphate translocator At3g11320 [Ipomoea triloba]|uniref:probable sugar phosphate/phosphate translocator At3g11320 n=1 Tax=Ipomoea triloba TaxID=35885 RepID=UPI00125E63AA|nr:probable sugar phosphate/phosphate translocator At3g11320 [Ipomoea triloba]
MVKGSQGERVRLYVRGTVLGYKRSKSNQYPNTSLIQIEGVNTQEEVAWYLGKRMAYVYKAKTKKGGSHYRCIWGKVCRPHGNSGVVRAKFKSNLPPKSMGNKVRVFMYPSNITDSMSVMKTSGRFFTIGLVGAWYSSNIGVLLLNKYLLSNYGFKYPIFLTMCHMTACSLLSYIAIAWMKMVPVQTIRSRVQFLKIAALSLVFCTSVVSGNISLRYLPVSFNQAIGATTPFFTAVFAYLMTLKREAWLTYVTLIPVVTGVVIASGGEPSFHLFGFIVCIGATAARALKSVLQGILLSSEGEKLNSMNLLLYMAPIAVVLLLPATIIMEENVVGITLALARNDTKIVWLLLFNSALAYFVNLTNFLVTKHTSALTLQVLGNAKGAVAVVVSILIFRNPVSVTGMLGYSLTVFGVVLYSEAKKRSR